MSRKANRRKVYPWSTFVKGKKQSDTVKLANQLTATAILDASGRAFDGKSSPTRNQGILPGPLANIMMNR